MNDSDHLLSLGCPQFSCAQISAWKWAGKALCPHGLPWKGATYLRLGVHSPLLPASGPLLPRQGPKLFLGRVLVTEETEGRDRQSGKPGHGGWGTKAVNLGCGGDQSRNCSQREAWPQKAWDRMGRGHPRPGAGRGGGLGGWLAECSRGPRHPRICWLTLLEELPCELPWRVHNFHQILRKGPKPKPGQKEFRETDLQLE